MNEAEMKKILKVLLGKMRSTIEVDHYHPFDSPTRKYFLREEGCTEHDFDKKKDAVKFKKYFKAWLQKAKEGVK